MKKKLLIGLLVFRSSLCYAAPVWGQDNIDLVTYQDQVEENEMMNDIESMKIPVLETQERTYYDGWLLKNTNIRNHPNINDDGNIAFVLPQYSKILFTYCNEEWCMAMIDGETYYLHTDLISTEEISGYSYSTPSNGIKSYMPYTAITNRSSKQYKLQQVAYTGNHGIRQINGRYCAAVGSAYTTQVGQYFDLVLENGAVIPCILADCKADKDTNADNTITAHDGSLVEFIVDTGSLSSTVKRMGDISYAQDDWNSMITSIVLYDTVEE